MFSNEKKEEKLKVRKIERKRRSYTEGKMTRNSNPKRKQETRKARELRTYFCATSQQQNYSTTIWNHSNQNFWLDDSFQEFIRTFYSSKYCCQRIIIVIKFHQQKKTEKILLFSQYKYFYIMYCIYVNILNECAS